MSGNIDTKSCIGPRHREWVLAELRRGDQARIADLVGTKPGYVKDVFKRRPTAKSVLSERIWLAGYRYLKLRKEIAEELNPAKAA
jgi:hypothetical protein